MAVPSIHSIDPFDATRDYVLNYYYTGEQVYKAEISIRQANTLAEAYTRVIGSGLSPIANNCTIPSGSLTNGVKYGVRIRVSGLSGQWSEWSNEVIFYCFTTPQLNFVDLPASNVVQGNAFTAKIQYGQNEGEPLQSYRFFLYDVNKRPLYVSDYYYSTADINYYYTNLENNMAYYIRCEGYTLHRMSVDSGYIMITVAFTIPPTSSSLHLVNDPVMGYITCRTDIKIVEYDGEEVFSYDDGWIDLQEKTIKYEEGVDVSGDFTLWARAKDVYKNENSLIKLASPNGVIYVSSIIHDEMMPPSIFFKLTVTTNDENTKSPLDYIIYTSSLGELTETDEVVLIIQRKGNIYSLDAFVNNSDLALSGGSFWLGKDTPIGKTDRAVGVGEAWANAGTYTEYIDGSRHFYSSDEPVDDRSAVWLGGE